MSINPLGRSLNARGRTQFAPTCLEFNIFYVNSYKNKEVYLMSVQKLNQNNFHNTIANGTVLVDFYADWCGPCRMVSPIVDEIAEERSDITVGKVNVDDENTLAMKYGVMSIPTLIVFQDGKEKTRIVGARPKAAILAELV